MIAACGEANAMVNGPQQKPLLYAARWGNLGWRGEMVEGINDEGVTAWLTAHVPAN